MILFKRREGLLETFYKVFDMNVDFESENGEIKCSNGERVQHVQQTHNELNMKHESLTT